jgi:hypothetical protein
MSGYREKKLLLSTTKQEFIDKMNFHNEEEKKRCEIYLELKGIAYHVVLANYIGLNRFGKIEYRKVQNLYKYDKKVRNILYRFMAAFEEGVRAFISNRYNNDFDRIKELSKSLLDSIQDDSSLSKELENQDFFHLMELAKKLTPKEKTDVFGNVNHLDANLDAVRELRNTISHHRLLFVYEDFEYCYLEDGSSGDTLVDNIKNLIQLIHPYYKGFLKDELNQSCTSSKDFSFKNSLPNNAIINIK